MPPDLGAPAPPGPPPAAAEAVAATRSKESATMRDEVLAQRFGLDLLELFADVAHEARKLFVGDQRQDGEAGANLAAPKSIEPMVQLR